MKTKLFKTKVLLLFAVFAIHLNAQAQLRQSQTNATQSTALQQAKENPAADIHNPENQSPFDAVKGLKEDLSKRDAFSKHYINEDGSFTALIGAGPIHYEKNGQFLDIDHRISQNMDSSFPFANTTNLMESYFGATVEYGVKSITMEGEVVEFMNPTMYWEVNGQAMGTQQAANTQAQIQADKATYPNIYGDISAEYKVLTGKREMNYIIPNPEALGAVPAGADYLVFTEDVVLPFGWTSSLTETGIMIKDAMGQEIYLYENPHSTDAESHALREENTIFETLQIGNTLTIKTKVKTEWLLSNERVFPVMVDPNITVYPNGTTQRTAQMGSSGIGEYGTIAVGYLGGYYRSYASFNTASIPDNSSIDQVVLHHNVGGGQFMSTGTDGGSRGSEIRAFLNDPGSYSTWLNRYNAVTNATNSPTIYNTVLNLGVTGWKPGVVLGTTANTHLKNGLVNDRFSIGYRPAGNYNTTSRNEYALLYGEAHDNRPYLFVTYIPPSTPPTCATLIHPANNSIGSGNQNLSLSWNEVAGATSYDLYFGTTSNPPLLASDLQFTSTLISDCLDPNTKYYWKVIPKNAYGSPTTCSTWSFTTDGKLHIYQNDWETATTGFFGTSGTSVDGWYTNNNSGSGGSWSSGYNNTWTVGTGPHAINGNSVGVSALQNGGLAGDFFQYWSDLGVIHRWIYRPFDMRGLRDIEVSFKWKAGGEANQDYGSVISSINGGATWLMDEQGGLYNDGKYWNSPHTIREQTVLFPETRNNQQNFQLGFKWDDQSGNGVSGDPSFVVDDIIVKACPFEGEILSDEVGPGIYEWVPAGSTETTLTIDGSHPCAQFEWEQSIDEGVTWTVITGANTDSYTTPNDLTVSTWYRSRVYFGTGCPGVYQEEPFKVIIEKCESTTVWTSSGWSPSVPTVNTTKIVFEADYNSDIDTYPVSGGLIGCSVEVKEGVNVVIAAAHSITIDNEIKVATGASFTLKDGANLVQINDDAVNSGNITVKKEFTFSAERNQYNFVISPVVGQNIKELFENNNYKAQWYNETTNYFIFFEGEYDELGGAGIGQAIEENQNGGLVQTATYEGEPHNGIIKVDGLSNGYSRYHLAGNPYPSHLDLVKFYNENSSNIDSDFRFWDNRGNTQITQQGDDYGGSNYALFNAASSPDGTGTAAPGAVGDEKEPTKDVAVGNAFLLRLLAEPDETSYTFNNAQRTIGQGQNFLGRNTTEGNASSSVDRYWLTMHTPGQISVMNAVVYFDGGNDAFAKDDSKITGGSDDIYSIVEEHKLKIQGKSSFEISDTIALGYKAFHAGTHSINLYQSEGVFTEGVNILLIDKALEITQNLSAEGSYSFTTEAGEFQERFIIVYEEQGTEEPEEPEEPDEPLANVEIEKGGLIVYKHGNQTVISSDQVDLLQLEVFNLQGQKLMNRDKIHAKTYRLDNERLGKQALLLVVKTADGKEHSFKILTQ
ncbi:MAG: hypothetical protein GX159_07305 [Flavobacteriaceae bacterium]|jgi:hypothetical protein|nr:hypothetical protein [Flavobacteriaceae bacterium]